MVIEKGTYLMGFPGSSTVKNLPAKAGDMDSIPGSGRSPGEGNGNLLQYSFQMPGKSCGQRSLAGYSPQGHKRVGHDLATKNNNLSHSIYESNNQVYVKGTVPGL